MIEFNPQNVDMHVVSGFKGVLVVGDPLLGPHKRVGRGDDVWEAGLDKLTQALDIAEKNEWLPLIVGDIIHDAKDIGQLLPLIQLLKGRRAILLPRNNRWAERSQGHLAAILQASGIASVAGFSARRFQVPIAHEGSWVNLTLESQACWGGHQRLDQGERARIVVPELGLTITQGSELFKLDGDRHGSILEVGRLIRLTQAEEKSPVGVFSLSIDGIKMHELKTTPVVFSDSAGSALDKNLELNRDSLFVDKLRASTEEALEDEGKGSLLTLIDEVCAELESDPWIQSTLLSLAKEAAV